MTNKTISQILSEMAINEASTGSRVEIQRKAAKSNQEAIDDQTEPELNAPDINEPDAEEKKQIKKSKTVTESGFDWWSAHGITEARVDHREMASHGYMHPDMAKFAKVGEHQDFYEHKTGDKKYGKVVHKSAKEVHYLHPETKKVQKFKIVNALPAGLNEGVFPADHPGERELNDGEKVAEYRKLALAHADLAAKVKSKAKAENHSKAAHHFGKAAEALAAGNHEETEKHDELANDHAEKTIGRWSSKTIGRSRMDEAFGKKDDSEDDAEDEKDDHPDFDNSKAIEVNPPMPDDTQPKEAPDTLSPKFVGKS